MGLPFSVADSSQALHLIPSLQAVEKDVRLLREMPSEKKFCAWTAVWKIRQSQLKLKVNGGVRKMSRLFHEITIAMN